MREKPAIILSNREKNRMYNEFMNNLPEQIKEDVKKDCESRDRTSPELLTIIKDALDDIKGDMWDRLERYENALKEKPAFNTDQQLLNEVSKTIQCIKSAWDYYQGGDIEEATEQIENLLEGYVNHDFFVSELNHSYAIRLAAYNDKLKDEGDDHSCMQQHPITLYRGRISEEPLKDRKQMLHRPYKKFEKIPRQRFTCEGMPALYLATTSYACWLELNEPQKDFYVSLFTPDEGGEKLRILNLVVAKSVVDGIYRMDSDSNAIWRRDLQNKMISFLPLIMATSYKNMKNNEEKEEYIIPELVMRSLKKYKIDGVAYISKNLDQDQDFQIGTNIAIPIYEEDLDQGYGKIAKSFKISEPELYSEDELERYKESKEGSFVYDVYDAYRKDWEQRGFNVECSNQPRLNGEEHKRQIYINAPYAHFDNYLAHKELKYYNE